MQYEAIAPTCRRTNKQRKNSTHATETKTTSTSTNITLSKQYKRTHYQIQEVLWF